MFRLATLLALVAAALAATTCNTDLDLYPYCISVPDGASKGTLFPTVLMLQGRGARGPASNVQSLATYDGFGKLVSEYNGGNKGDAQTLAATKFVVIVPVAPEYYSDGANGADPQYWQEERVMAVLDHAKAAGHPIDWNRFSCAGYSMGAFGCWRFTAYNSGMIASLVTSGGNAETNTITNTLGQTAQAPADMLTNIIKRKIPTRAFTGTGDTTIPMSWLEQTEASMEKLGAGKLSTLTVLDTDHTGLSTMPFTADLLTWMLKQKKSGSGKSSKPSKSKSGKSPKSTSKSKTSSKTSTAVKGGATKKKCTPAQKARRAQIAHAQALKRHALAQKQHGGL